MKRKILNVLALAAAVLGFTMCKDEGLPSNPVVQYPIKTLIVTLNSGNDDYTATPKFGADGSITDTMTVNTFKEQSVGIIKTIVLADPGMTASVKDGDNVAFVDGKLTIVLTKGSAERKICLDILYPKPEPEPEPDDVYYFAWNSGATEDPTSKIVGSVNPKLVSAANDGNYEGYVDLTGKGWYNIGVVNPAKTKFYDHDHAAALPSNSYFTLAMTEKDADNNMFPFAGPWAGWDGMWKANFNSASKELTMLKTVWTINGTATGGTAKSMTYNTGNRKWTVDVSLSVGAFKFSTLALNAGDPVVTYGDKGGKALGASGSDIAVTEAASYTVTLDLTSAPNYKYTIVKKTDPVVGDYVSFITWHTPTITASTPKIYDLDGDNIYEGHVYLGSEATEGTPMALVNSSKNLVYTGSGWYMIPFAGITDPNFGYPLGYASRVLRTEPYPASTGTGIPGECGPAAKWNYASGVWFFRLDLTVSDAHVLIIQTEWTIAGTAVGATPKAMTYSIPDKKWSVTADLAAGNFKFVNPLAGKFRNDLAPVDGPESMSFVYGLKDGTTLKEDGGDIAVAAAGNYTITLDLSTAYMYSIKKN